LAGAAVRAACKRGIIALGKTTAREMARPGATSNVVCAGLPDAPLLAMEAGRAAAGGGLQPILFGGLLMFSLVAEPDGVNTRWNTIEVRFRMRPFP
jgi:NAD(P)-dependent dehydrogenase (short-subunit alcohol dehydrogenase family)